MSISLSSVTGAAVTGLTSPTYTLTQDTNPVPNSKQWVVTALGGTQTGVDANLASKPFRVTAFKPVLVRSLPAVNPVTGVLRDVPKNRYTILFGKGAQPLANQPNELATVKVEFSIPAGTEVYEPEELKALVSLFCGYIATAGTAQGIYDTISSAAL